VLTGLKNYTKYTWCGCLMLGAAQAFGATPSVTGQSGYINMPSAWTESDGTFSVGYSYDSPYGETWFAATVLPFLQVTGRYVSITGIPAFGNPDRNYGKNYGRYKDKVVDAKVRLWNETSILPAVSVGATDLQGTELFKGQYIVASKSFGARNIEASIGYGNKRPKGVFAGVRWAPLSIPRWAVVAEYDAIDYRKDIRAVETGASRHASGPALGLEYRWGWLGAQVARHRDHFSANAYLAIPFSAREFVPKLFEPPYFQAKDAPARVSAEEWWADDRHATELVQALVRQDFRNVRVEFEGHLMKLSLTNTRISNMGRAVGRAARTALAYAPTGTRGIHITYTRLEQPIATYEFFDLQSLTDYLTGLIDRDAFLQTVLVRQARPDDHIDFDPGSMLTEISSGERLQVQEGVDGNVVQVVSEDREANRFSAVPKLGFFFNDPSGALRYELAAGITYDRRVGEGLYLNSALRLDLFENVSGVTQPSNSLLPHVRTDVAKYKQGDRLKLNRLLLNKYMMPAERFYARVSAGFYEEMYRGAGGQILYVPKDSRWAADVAVDALQQRGYRGWLDKLNYQTATGLVSLHYRLPYNVTATARAGRFLARDDGVRFEFKRRFPSGMELGMWYSRTNGHDITSPGTPAKPYNDKGVFLSVPLNIMLTADTQSVAGIGLSPWTRDVGQMVVSPGDLYDLVEQPRRDMTTFDGLGNFAERRDEQNLSAVNPPVDVMPNPWPLFRMRVDQAVKSTPTLPQTANGVILGGGAILASTLLDKPVDRFMKKHQGSRAARAWDDFGKATPVVLAGAAVGAVAFGDAHMQNIGIISLESIAGAAALSIAGKHVAGRARPNEEQGQWGKAKDSSNASFPSNHASVAFAAVTPFPQEYNAPWLYGLAAAGSLGRTAGRQHWVSDVVAGSVLGMAVGGWLWQAQRTDTRSNFTVTPGAKSIGVAWLGNY